MPSQEIMPPDPRKKSVASFFDDDDDILPASRRGVRTSRTSGENTWGLEEEDVTVSGLGHVTLAGSRKKKPLTPEAQAARSAHKVLMEGLAATLRSARKDVNVKLHDADEFIIEQHAWEGSDVIKEIVRVRAMINQKVKKNRDEWFEKHETQIKENKAARAARKAIPHTGIHKERVFFMHEQTVEAPLEKIEQDVNDLIETSGKPPEMTNPLPTEHHGEYYIYKALQFLSRSKYQAIQALHHWLHAKHPRDAATLKLEHHMQEIKKAKDHAESIQKEMRSYSAKKKKKSKRTPWQLPDKGNLPKQTPYAHRV